MRTFAARSLLFGLVYLRIPLFFRRAQHMSSPSSRRPLRVYVTRERCRAQAIYIIAHVRTAGCLRCGNITFREVTYLCLRDRDRINFSESTYMASNGSFRWVFVALLLTVLLQTAIGEEECLLEHGSFCRCRTRSGNLRLDISSQIPDM